VPYQPLNLHADAISPNEILVKWDAPQEADVIMSYELYYNDSHTRQNVRVSIHPPVPYYRIEDLTPDTIYHIQVSAKSTRGEGPKTPTIQAKTQPFSEYFVGVSFVVLTLVYLCSLLFNGSFQSPSCFKMT
jgi:netrin-G3 ligand